MCCELLQELKRQCVVVVGEYQGCKRELILYNDRMHAWEGATLISLSQSHNIIQQQVSLSYKITTELLECVGGEEKSLKEKNYQVENAHHQELLEIVHLCGTKVERKVLQWSEKCFIISHREAVCGVKLYFYYHMGIKKRACKHQIVIYVNTYWSFSYAIGTKEFFKKKFYNLI